MHGIYHQPIWGFGNHKNANSHEFILELSCSNTINVFRKSLCNIFTGLEYAIDSMVFTWFLEIIVYCLKVCLITF